MTSHGPLGSFDSPDRKPLVLLAEDDDATAEMLETLLGNAGYRVRVARDGAVALRMLDDVPVPHVVLLDWMLPELTGLELCRRIRERWDALQMPVLMVTAKADPESKSAALKAGANDYITKPFLGAELRARVAAHLRIKQLSEERLAIDEHLMEREKLSTLGLLVSGVAHDLNNPLAGISGYTQLLLEEESNPENRMLLERILEDVKRCNRIVMDLLSFARRQAPERAEVDLRDLLTRTLALRDRQLQIAGLEPRLEMSDELPVIIGDFHQLQQVFLNILVNAEHALRDAGSTLRVAARRADAAETEVETVIIDFFNDGPAIPHALIPHIFDPFFTTKERDEGTGLGLAICRRVVREHGGEIEVKSDDEGTTFTISIPIGREGEDAASTGRKASVATRGRIV